MNRDCFLVPLPIRPPTQELPSNHAYRLIHPKRAETSCPVPDVTWQTPHPRLGILSNAAASVGAISRQLQMK